VEQPSKGCSGTGWKACATNKFSTNASKEISLLQKPNRTMLMKSQIITKNQPWPPLKVNKGDADDQPSSPD